MTGIPTPEGERRANDSLVVELMREIHTDVKLLDKKLTEHIAEETEEFKLLIKSAFACSFPAGDAEGHRKVHEADIQRALDRAEFWKKMLYEITKYGLLGVLGWIAIQLWVAFVNGPK